MRKRYERQYGTIEEKSDIHVYIKLKEKHIEPQEIIYKNEIASSLRKNKYLLQFIEKHCNRVKRC